VRRGSGQFAGEALGAREVDIDDDDAGTGFGKYACRGFAYAASAARDERDSAV
jgi:hypothetical protein